jgi:hypothetical protein
MEQRVLRKLTAETTAGPFLFHYEPTELMQGEMPEIIRKYLEAFDELTAQLKMRFPHQLRVFVYKDATELADLTGSVGAGGLACPDWVLHVARSLPPHHELIHQLARAWNEPGNDPVVSEDEEASGEYRSIDWFADEGLACALERVDTLGIPQRDWIAFCVRLGAKPDLKELAEGFGQYPDGVNSYTMAGTVIAFLIDRYGIGKVKEWFHRRTAEAEIFGKSFDALSAEWREWIARAPVDPMRFARALPDSVWFETRLKGQTGPGRVIAAATQWFVLFHNGRELGGGWMWWWPRSFDLDLTGDDTFRVLAMDPDRCPGFWFECARPGGEVLVRSDPTWSATDLDGRAVPVQDVTGSAITWGTLWSKEGRDRTLAIRGRRIWRKPA